MSDELEIGLKEKKMKKIIFAFALLFMAGCTPEQSTNEDSGKCPYDYKEKIRARLNERLKDPYSAIYRFSKPQKYVSNGEVGDRVVVGLNAKNSFGGYVGEKIHHFFCFEPRGSLSEINEKAADFTLE